MIILTTKSMTNSSFFLLFFFLFSADLRHHVSLSLLHPLPLVFPSVVHLVGVVRTGPAPPFQRRFYDVTALLLLQFPAHLLLPAARTAGGVAPKLYIC